MLYTGFIRTMKSSLGSLGEVFLKIIQKDHSSFLEWSLLLLVFELWVSAERASILDVCWLSSCIELMLCADLAAKLLLCGLYTLRLRIHFQRGLHDWLSSWLQKFHWGVVTTANITPGESGKIVVTIARTSSHMGICTWRAGKFHS